MWDGWTSAEKNEILKEVYLDRHGMVAFHKKVLNSQFFWWSLVPVLGCATASMRWKATKKNKRKYGLWAHCSHMALTKDSVIVVGIPSEDRLHLPAQEWPRECVKLQSISDAHIENQPSRVCCVPNTVRTVRLKLTDRSDRMQLVGMLDPKQFIEDVLSIQAGNWTLTANQRLSIAHNPQENESAPLIQPGTHTNPLFDPTSEEEGASGPEISLAENLNAYQEAPDTIHSGKPSKTKAGKGHIATTEVVSDSVLPSKEISAFHGFDGQPIIHTDKTIPEHNAQHSNEAGQDGRSQGQGQSKTYRSHERSTSADETDIEAVESKYKKNSAQPANGQAEDAEDDKGTWCWEVSPDPSQAGPSTLVPKWKAPVHAWLLPYEGNLKNRSLDSLDETVEGWQPATYEEVHHMKHPPDLAALVEDTKGRKTKGGIDLDNDIRPCDADSTGVCELASETAEWWGPEWGSDEEDPDITGMTASEAEAVLLGCRVPPPTEDEIAQLPGAEETWRKYPRCKPKARAVSEARLKAALEVEEALAHAFSEARKVKAHPLVSDQVPMILHVLSDIRNTVQQVVDDSGGAKRNSRRFSSRLSLDPQEVLSRYTRAL